MNRLLVSAVLAAFASACGGSSSGGSSAPAAPTTSTRFQGVVAGTGGQSGTLSVTINTTVAQRRSDPFSLFPVLHAQSSTTATGTVVIAGASTTVSGTYDSASGALNLSGSGFAMTGSLKSGVLGGTYTGPSGSSGGFSMLNAAGGVVTYCGTFTSGSTRESGVWNLEISGGVVSGIAISNVPPPTTLRGTVSGSTITLTTSEGGSGTGTISSDVISGTGNNNTVFAGSQSACNSSTSPTPGGSSGPTTHTYVGPITGQFTVTTTSGGVVSCTATWSVVGGLTLTVTQQTDGTVSGTGQASFSDTLTVQSCGRSDRQAVFSGSVTGNTANITFSSSVVSNGTTNSLSFGGALSGGVITGTATRSENTQVNGTVNNGTATYPVTLR